MNMWQPSRGTPCLQCKNPDGSPVIHVKMQEYEEKVTGIRKVAVWGCPCCDERNHYATLDVEPPLGRLIPKNKG